MASRERTVVYVRIVIEAERGNIRPSARHAELQIYRGLDSVNNCNIAFTFSDRNDVETKRSTFKKLGELSDEMKALIREELGPEDEDPQPAAKTA